MSSEPAEEVKIKLKHGEWEVEVTCLESRVKQVIENVLSSLDTTKMVGPALQSQLDELRQEIDSLKMRPITLKFPIFSKLWTLWTQWTLFNLTPEHLFL